MPFSWWDKLVRELIQPAPRSTRSSRRLTKRRQATQSRVLLNLEKLESREVPAALSAPMAVPDYIVYKHGPKIVPLESPGSEGFTPAQVAQAYGINQVSFDGAKATGAGTTIAIVDAYSSPTITTDLQAFDKEFGLPNPVLKVVNQTGGSTPPAANAGWAGEITLDVEWAHATAPGANILLVEANSASDSDLYTAVRYAEKQPGVVAVSMSFGSSEFPGETAYDSSTFSWSANPDLVFLASSGDNGAPPKYPSVSPDVLAVGGTSLYLTSSNNYLRETGWGDSPSSSSSGGISAYEKQPAYQQGVVKQSTTMRTTPDVSLVADPETGVWIYQTYGNSGTPWEVIGGTSDASPQWAGLIALTDQGRALAGEAPLNNSILMPELYSLPTTSTASAATADFHDILTGESLGTPHYSCGVGYDLVTGIGTPIVNNLIPTLVGNTSAASFTISAPVSVDAGLAFSVTVIALGESGQRDTQYNGTVSFSSSDLLAGLPGSYTFTSTDSGAHTFTVTLNSLGDQSLTVSDDSNASLTATTSVDVEPGYTFNVSGFPSSIAAGTPGTFTVTALAANGSILTGYTGTVVISSSDPSLKPFDVTLTNGTGTFSATLTKAGTQSLTATDSVNTTMTGSETGIDVTPDAPVRIGFVQEPTVDYLGSVISPTVAVAEVDQYNNIDTLDSSGQVTISLASAGSATLGGTLSATFNNGVASFSNLSVNQLGAGYILVASSNGLTGTTSTPFSVVYNTLLENFTNGLTGYEQAGASKSSTTTTAAAAHPGTATMGLSDGGDLNWYYRTDPAGAVNPGDTVSVWVQFAGGANGRAYFGFGSTSKGTLSVVLAPNTNQLLVQNDAGYNTYTTLAATPLTYSYNTWYKVQVEWGTSGQVIVNLYASDGVTLVKSLSVTTKDTTPGDFAFRAIGPSPKYFSTVSVVRGVNDFIAKPSDLAAQTNLSTQVGSIGGSGPAVSSGSLATDLLSMPNSTQMTSELLPLIYQPTVQTAASIDLALLQTVEQPATSEAELSFGLISDLSGQDIQIVPDDGLLILDTIS